MNLHKYYFKRLFLFPICM